MYRGLKNNNNGKGKGCEVRTGVENDEIWEWGKHREEGGVGVKAGDRMCVSTSQCQQQHVPCLCCQDLL